jgi:hypothetical protein
MRLHARTHLPPGATDVLLIVEVSDSTQLNRPEGS